MNPWLKRIGLIAAALIALEVVAAIGIFLIGPRAVRDILTMLDPSDSTPAVTQSAGGGVERRCATYMGELFCITEGDAPPETPVVGAQSTPAEANEQAPGERCAVYDGQLICVQENI